MTRFHVHVGVEDIDASIRFYSTLFAAEPTVRKSDYAKWMLENPRVNFAISQSDNPLGVQHLGIQAENEDELAEVYDRLSGAERPILEEKGAACCYAKSDKQWVADPQGVAWETFLTHEEATVFGDSRAISELREMSVRPSACSCAPVELEKPSTATAAACRGI